MPRDAKRPAAADHDDLYRLIRTDAERIVNELLAVMRKRREHAVDAHMRESAPIGKKGIRAPISEADAHKLEAITMSHATGLALALLQGAVEAFEDQEEGLKLLKEIIESELVEIEQEASFVSQATSRGSTAIN